MRAGPQPGRGGGVTRLSRRGHDTAGGHHPGWHASGADPSRQPGRQSPETSARVTVPQQPVRPATGTSRRGPSRDRGRSESPAQQAVARVLGQSHSPAAPRKAGSRNQSTRAVTRSRPMPLMPMASGPGRGRSVTGRGNGHRQSNQGGPGPAASERDRARPGTGRGRHANVKESRQRSGARTASGPNRTTPNRAGPEQRGDRVKESVRTQPRATTKSRQRNRRGTAGPGGRGQITVIRSTQIEKTELRYVCLSAPRTSFSAVLC